MSFRGKKRLGVLVAAAGILMAGASAQAGGFGEQRSIQFRSPTERQLLLNMERARLDYNFLKKASKNGCCAGAGTLTSQGTSASVNNNYFYQEIHTSIDGDGNEVIVSGGSQESSQSATDITQSNQNATSGNNDALNPGAGSGSLN